jgi:hypothetical protein
LLNQRGLRRAENNEAAEFPTIRVDGTAQRCKKRRNPLRFVKNQRRLSAGIQLEARVFCK